jgi:hypothetical protein
MNTSADAGAVAEESAGSAGGVGPGSASATPQVNEAIAASARIIQALLERYILRSRAERQLNEV